MVADSECDNARSSAVQIAPLASQSVVSGNPIVTAPAETGSTVISHATLLPCCSRSAFRTAPPLTLNAASRNVT